MAYLIDSDGATVGNAWTNGNPSLGVKATLIDATWLNMVQDEFNALILSAGLTLNKVDSTQLKQAVDIKLARGGKSQNLAIVRSSATTVKITSANGTALSASNPAFVTLMDPGTPGTFKTFTMTADVSIVLTGAHFAMDNHGDYTGTLLRILAINDNGTLRFGVALLGGRFAVLTTDCFTTGTSVTLPEHILTSSAVASSTNSCDEIGFIRADFTDSSNDWAIQTGISDVVTGRTCDGLHQPWRPTYTGFSSAPTLNPARTRWSQTGRTITIWIDTSINGTSNATTFTMTAPAKAAIRTYGAALTVDNSTTQASTGRMEFNAGTQSFDVFKDWASALFTASGGKTANFGFTSFEVGPVASFVE